MYTRIIVPVDGSATSLKGLAEAIRFARGSDARVKLIHVVDELVLNMGEFVSSGVYEQLVAVRLEQGNHVLDQAESFAQQQGMTVEKELIERIGGRAADSIIDAAKNWPADLIVMGTHGRRGLKRLALGSDAELVLRLASVPVLLVRNGYEGQTQQLHSEPLTKSLRNFQ